MKVSIVISPFVSTRLADALADVTAQTHTDWELIIVEATDSDENRRAVEAAGLPPAKVRYERMHDDGSGADVRNRALELAQAEAIAFLEPQDSWQPRHLATAVPFLAGGADVVVSGARMHEAKNEQIANEIPIPSALTSSPVRTLFTRDAIPSLSCVVARRSTVVAAGTFDTRLRSLEGRDFWLRCALNGARFVATQRATCRCGRVKITAAERGLQAAEQAVLFYEKHRDLSAVPAALRRRLLAGALVAHGRLLRPIDSARAARCFMRAWSLQPVHVQTLGQFALTEWRSSAGPGEPKSAP